MQGMNKFLHLIFLLFAFGLVSSCEDDDDDDRDDGPSSLSISVALRANNSAQYPGSVFQLNDSTEILLETIRFYYSYLRLVDEEGDTLWLADYGFFDLEEPVQGMEDRRSIRYNVPEGEYVALMLNVGLDSAQNATDPSSVPLEDPLSAAYGMFWTWASQYRFVMVEGRVNAPGMIGSSDDQAFSYHPGNNDLYQRDLVIPIDLEADDGASVWLPLVFDADTWFDGPGGSIDPFLETTAHGSPQDRPLALKFIRNFSASVR